MSASENSFMGLWAPPESQRAGWAGPLCQATAMRIDIAPHKRPRRNSPQHVPDPHHFHILHTPSSAISPLNLAYYILLDTEVIAYCKDSIP